MAHPAKSYDQVTPKTPVAPKLSSEHEQATKPTEHYDQSATVARQAQLRQAIQRTRAGHPDLQDPQ